jgi:hypothetical protein
MTDSQIYSALQSRALRHSSFFGRRLYIVKRSDFEAYGDFFSENKNLLNAKRNFRTNRRFKHIHAIQTGDLVEFHWDYGNLYASRAMAVPHFLFDVIPYFVWHLLTFKKPYSIE